MTDPPSLPSALVDLASAAGDQPLALAGIEERTRRMRVRRGAGRAAIVTVCCAGLATGIALAGAGGPQVYRISASVPAPVVLDRCTTISAMAQSGVDVKGPGVPSPSSPNSAIGAKVAAGLPRIGGLFKAPGTVTGVPTRDAVTIAVAAPLYSTPQKVTFAITAQTAFQSGGQPIVATILRAGSQIGFVATRTGSDSFRLELVDTNPDALSRAKNAQPKTTVGVPDGAASAKAAAAKAAANGADEPGPPPIGGTLEGKGTVTAVSAGAVSLDVRGGALAGQTLSLTVTPATQFAAAGRQCDPSGLPSGTPMGFTATRTGAATYRLDQLNT